MKDIDRVVLTYNDSANPGRILLKVGPDALTRGVRLTLTPADAVALAERLLDAVRSEGYSLTATKGR